MSASYFRCGIFTNRHITKPLLIQLLYGLLVKLLPLSVESFLIPVGDLADLALLPTDVMFG